MSARAILGAALISYLGLLVPSAAGQLALSEISHIHGISFDIANPGNLLLATHYGIYRARPDGFADVVSEDANDYMGFSMDPSDGGRLLASGHPRQGGNLGLIASKDGGITWTAISDGVGGPVDFHAMSISPANSDVIYGLHKGIQVSIDGGTTWSIAGAGPGQVIDLAASPIDARTVYAATVTGLMRSIDGAASWSLVSPAGRAATMVEATTDGSVYVFFDGAGLYRLSKLGNWQELATTFGESHLLHIAADPEDAAHLVATTGESAVVESLDGGRTWTRFGQ